MFLFLLCRKEWISSLELQEEFYNTQMQYLKERNLAAEEHLKAQMGRDEDVHEHILGLLKLGREKGPGQISTVSYIYPATLTSTGVPVSGGAALPYRRPPRPARGVCCQ